MLRFFLIFVAVTFLLCGGTFCQDGTQNIADVYKILQDHNIPFDANKTRRVTVETLVKAVDPGAVLYTAEQFHKFLLEKSVEKEEEWPEDICYLKIKGIYRDGSEEIAGRLMNWNAAGKAGVILDLRGAGGENLASVDRITGLYVSGDPLLYQLKDGCGSVVKNHRLNLESKLLGGNMPLMVLVDGATGEASELLAALLKNRAGVLLIGAKTKGDANVRENIVVSKDEIIHIAAKRIVINGLQYDLKGVEPDIVVTADAGKENRKLLAKAISVKPESEKARNDRALMEKVYPDPVLLRTTDILLGMKATVSYGIKTTTDTPTPAGSR